MNHILLFESFKKKDFITYKGEKGKVVSTEGNKLEIKIFKFKEHEMIDKDDPDLEKMKRCTGQCDKRIVEIDGERNIKCFGCDRVLTNKKKKVNKLEKKVEKKSKKRRGIKK